MRYREGGNHAGRRLPVLLCVQRLRREAAAQAGRLLRVLLVWLGAMPARSGRACGLYRRGFLLREVMPDGKRHGANLSGLARQPARQSAGVVDSSSRHRCRIVGACARSNRDLDHRAHLDGYGMNPEFKTVRPNPLPLHGTLLPHRDRARSRAWFWCRVSRYLRLAYVGRLHSRRQQDHLVGHRACVGEILLAPRLPWPRVSYEAGYDGAEESLRVISTIANRWLNDR
jgi:hypothetical protein